MARKGRNKKDIYYKNLFFGGKSILLRAYITFATLPFYTKLYMDAFFRTLYRLFISHKNLLNWITAEEVEKTVNGSLKNYIRNLGIGEDNIKIMEELDSIMVSAPPNMMLTDEAEEYMTELERQKFNDAVDLVMYIEF